MPLSDAAIRNAKPRDRAYKLADGGGLHLYVTPRGSKLWRLKYRFDGREKLLSFGAYPTTSLKAARLLRDEAKTLLSQGQGPSEVRESESRKAAAARANTFSTVSQSYREKLVVEGRAPATLARFDRLLDMVTPKLGRRPISEIETFEVLAVLKEVEGSGRLETARKLKTAIGSIFRFAIAAGATMSDPTQSLHGALATPRVVSRPAITNRRQFGALLRSIDAFDGYPTTRIGLELLALLACRSGELRHARWSEFDLYERFWLTPANRTKSRRQHRAPLADQTIAKLIELRSMKLSTQLVLPSPRSPHRALSENTLNSALRRMGFGKEQMTSHGFRATFSTLANEVGLWSPDAIERHLGHIEANEVRGAYARGEHWQERVRMAGWWADQMDAFRREAVGHD